MDTEDQLPTTFVDLAKNNAFAALLRRVEESGASEPLRAQLVRKPLSTASVLIGELTRDELALLESLRKGSTSNYRRSKSLLTNLRHLRDMGLIYTRPHIGHLPDEFDLSTFVELTPRGEDFPHAPV